MQTYAAGVIAERRTHPKDDLISGFCMAEIDGERLREREVLLTTTTLIMAGIESLGGFSVMFGLNLADFADARRALVDNPALIPDAIEESLRFNTSAQRFRRRLIKDTQLHGQSLKAGDFVCMAYGSGNRDERQYPNPERYDIRRKPRGHLGFGGGVHACLGSMVARLAVRIIFEEFLRAYPDFERTESELPWMPSTTFRSPTRLLIAVH
jgi:cytochrome P450